MNILQFNEAYENNTVECPLSHPSIIHSQVASAIKAVYPELNLQNTINAKTLFNKEPDILNFILCEFGEFSESDLFQIFGILKYNCCYKNVPWEFAQIILWCYSTYSTLNELSNSLSSIQINTLLSTGFSRKYIDSVINSNFTPVSEFKLKVNNTKIIDAIDIYLPKLNRIAIMKKSFSDKLDYDDIDKINLVKNKLCIGEIPLIKLLGGLGATAGIYDLYNAV